MPRKPKKTAPPPAEQKNYDEFADETEVPEEEVALDDAAQIAAKLRDWRDVEKLKEERRLRRLIDDDMDIGEAFVPASSAAPVPAAKRKR